MSEFGENVSVSEGTDAYGTTTTLHIEQDALITQKTYDATPILEQCHAERIATDGQRWGELRKVGTLPMAEYAKAMRIRDNAERRKYIKNWLLANPYFISFERYAK